MYHEDLKEVLRTNLATTEKKFGLGRLRIQLQLFMQLAGFTANRPNAILGLCYRHITVTLLRDPDGGPHRVLLEFTYEFTKQYLGIKDMYVSPFPIIYLYQMPLLIIAYPRAGIRSQSPKQSTTRPLSSALTYYSKV